MIASTIVTCAGSSRTGWQVFDEISRHEHAQMDRRTAALAEPMVTMGIGHVIEPLAQFDEAVHQSFRNLQMGVALARE